VNIPQNNAKLELQEMSELSEIIQAAHSDALSDDTWLNILGMVQRLVDADTSGGVFGNAPTMCLEKRVTLGVNPDLSEWYDAHCSAGAMMADMAQARGLNVWRPTDVLGKSEWEASAICNDLRTEFGLGEPIYISCGAAGKLSARFWFMKDSSKDDFTERDAHILNILQPHFCDALRLGQTVLEGNAYRDAFRQAWSPRFICDSSGKITEISAAARRLVEETDAEFGDVVADIEAISCGMVARRAECEFAELIGQRRRFTMSPIASPNTKMAYTLFIHSASHLNRILSRSMEACSFSQREVEVATLLVEGMSNQQIADKLFVAETTVKDYVATIFQKLGVSKRTGVLPRLLGF
jgi:DNA-binding CsgD family transcriptional regulator